jgi:hypothetical protein
MYGLIRLWVVNILSNPTAKSRIIGKLFIGSTVTTSESNSDILVKHASLGLPLMIIPHEPHVACLHEYRTPIE